MFRDFLNQNFNGFKVNSFDTINFRGFTDNSYAENNFSHNDLLNLTGINNIHAIGDSITVGSNASPVSNSYINLFQRNRGIATITNQAVGARGVWNQLQAFKFAVYTRSQTVITAMVGLNDIKRNGSNSKTLKKIEAGYKSYICKHITSTQIAATSGSVTRTGTFSTILLSTQGSYGTCSFNTTAGATWEYTFTGTSIGVIFMALDGVLYTGWGNANIYIDNQLIDTFTSTGVWYDGVSDGAYDNGRGPVPYFVFGLSNSQHTIKIESQTAAAVVLDVFFTLQNLNEIGPMVFFEIPYNTSLGYFNAPNQGSITASDLASDVIKNLVDEFSGYGMKIGYVPTNTYYDIGFGCDQLDGTHPNNAGHYQIFQALNDSFY